MLLKKHKKKAIFLLIVYLLYQFGKRSWLKRPMSALIGLIQRVIILRMEKEAHKSKRALVIVAKSEELAAAFKNKSIPKATCALNNQISEDYPTSLLYGLLKKKTTTGTAKSAYWNELGLKIYQRIVLTLLMKGAYDFSNYLSLLATAMMESERNHGSDRNSQYELLDLKGNVGSKEDLRSEAENKDIENASAAIKIFVKRLNELIFRRFTEYIKEVMDWEVEFPVDEKKLKERIGLNHFVESIFSVTNRILFLEATPGLKNRFSKPISLLSVDFEKVKIHLSSSSKFQLKSLLSAGFEETPEFEPPIFQLFMYQFKNLRVEEWQDSELSFAFSTSISLIKYFNLIIELITGDFFVSFNRLYYDYLSTKLYNRLMLLFKKEKGENSLWDDSSKFILAKLLTHVDIMLDEEFFSFDHLKIDQEMLLKKIKLAMYFLRLRSKHQSIGENKGENSELINEAKQDREDETPLNITLIGSINLESPKLIEGTHLFLKELLGFEMSVSALKELNRQLLQCDY